MILKSVVTPEHFGIPPEIMNPFNMPMWNKAVKELQKVEKYITPT